MHLSALGGVWFWFIDQTVYEPHWPAGGKKDKLCSDTDTENELKTIRTPDIESSRGHFNDELQVQMQTFSILMSSRFVHQILVEYKIYHFKLEQISWHFPFFKDKKISCKELFWVVDEAPENFRVIQSRAVLISHHHVSSNSKINAINVAKKKSNMQ